MTHEHCNAAGRVADEAGRLQSPSMFVIAAALLLAARAGEVVADGGACAAEVPAALRISCNTYNISFSTNETTCHDRGCCWDGQIDTAKG